MNRSNYTEWMFVLVVAFPILYMLGKTLFRYSFELDLLLVYTAVWISGPLLLLYSFLARRLAHKKKRSSLSLVAGMLWVGFMIFLVIKR